MMSTPPPGANANDLTALLKATKVVPTPSRPDIYRVCSYRATAWPDHILPHLATRHAKVQSRMMVTTTITSNGSLKALDKLPMELLVDICSSHLDLRSLLAFRQVNQRARSIVNGLHEYEALVKHGLDALWSTIHIDVASQRSAALLYQRLCEQTCSVCKARSGPLLFVPTFIRCCGDCFATESRFRMVSVQAATRNFSKYEQAVSVLPVYGVRQGVQSQTLFEPRTPAVLLDELEQRLQTFQDTDMQQAQMYIACIFAAPGLTELETTCLLPFYCPTTGDAPGSLSCAGCMISNSRDAAGILLEPLHLEGNLWTPEELRAHIDTCEHASELWDQTVQGSKETEELTWLRDWGDVGPGLGRLRKLPSM